MSLVLKVYMACSIIGETSSLVAQYCYAVTRVDFATVYS